MNFTSLSRYICQVTAKELGDTLSSARRQLLLPQVYVAELAGISSRQLIKWEAGRGNPSFAQLQSVLDVLGLTLSIDPKQVL